MARERIILVSGVTKEMGIGISKSRFDGIINHASQLYNSVLVNYTHCHRLVV